MNNQFYTPEDLHQWPSRKRAHFFNTLSGFKPVHLLGTVSTDGTKNLALFSQVMHLGANPALLGILFRPATVPRHSLKNIRETGFFTLNHVTEQMLYKAHQTAAKYPEEVDEFKAVGLTPLVCDSQPAPYVAESPVQIGLKLQEEIIIQANQTILIIGSIVELAYPESALRADGYLDLASQKVMACTGLDAYHLPAKLARLGYAEPGKQVYRLSNELF